MKAIWWVISNLKWEQYIMEHYEKPIMEIIETSNDAILTSNCYQDETGCPNETSMQPFWM